MQIAGMDVLVDGLQFPEGLRWHDGRLWFSDMHAHEIRAVDPATGRGEVVARLDDMPSGLGWLPDGSLIAVSMRRRELVRVAQDGHTSVHCDLTGFPGEYLNDMAVDARGRAYVGAREVRRLGTVDDLDARDSQQRDTIVLVHPDGRAEVADGAAFTPNGSAFTPDGRTLIVAEVRAHRLAAYDVAEDGALTAKRVFADIDPLIPDGICLDAEGAVWVGSALTSEFARVREGGEITDRITLPDGLWATCCELGGDDGRTLFLTATRADLAQVGRLVHGETIEPSTAQGWIVTTRADVPRAGV